FEGLEMVVVQGEPHLECPIGEAPLALQQLEDLGEDLVKRHGCPSMGQEDMTGLVRRPWGPAAHMVYHRWRGKESTSQAQHAPPQGACMSWQRAVLGRGLLPVL